MSRLVSIAIFLLSALLVHGQVGIRIGYNLNDAPEWDNYFRTIDPRLDNVFPTSLSFEVDYWTRLRNKRIEFYPYLSYHQASTNISGEAFLALRQIGLGLKSHIYLLDFHGDCDCPTFSKQGGVIKKGLFFLAGVGTDFAQKSVLDEPFRDGNIDVRTTIGLGLDLGITDLITISPFFAYQRYFDVSWHEVGRSFNLPQDNVSSSINQIQFGIRIGLRSDYEAPRF